MQTGGDIALATRGRAWEHADPIAYMSGGWWGVAFACGVLIAAAMVSLPTATQNAEDIRAFYAANRQIIVVQQIVGVLALGPFLGLTLTLARHARRRGEGGERPIVLAALVVAIAELASNVPPLLLASTSDATPGSAHSLTLIEDLSDAALFASIAFFSFATALNNSSWVRIAGLIVAALTLLRAFASPLGVSALDAVAPITFVAYVLVLSIRLITADRASRVMSTRVTGHAVPKGARHDG